MLVRHTGQSPERVAADIERDKILDAPAALDVRPGGPDRPEPQDLAPRRTARGEPPMVPELPPLPALTRAEGELIDRYLEVVDLLGRINPAHPGRHLPRHCAPRRPWSARRRRCGTRSS